MDRKSDYIFRYPVEQPAPDPQGDALGEMIRRQLESLLRLLTLYRDGEEVKADGFRLMMEREAIYPIFPSPMKPEKSSLQTAAPRPAKEKKEAFSSPRNAELYEPRITHIKTALESLLSVAVLESHGKPVKIDGFRLKDLNHWLIPSSGDPAEVFDHLATDCDCHCRFCYLQGNPPSLALERPDRDREEEWKEVKTRLKYFSPPAKRALFPALGNSYEILSHPHALNLLRELRRNTTRPFRLSTNGNALTTEYIQELSLLKPVYLYLSLNSSSPARRRKLMGVNHPETAIRSLPLLKEKKIPFATVIVPWPFPSLAETLADLKATAAYADRCDAHLVEVSLPGYSQYFPSGERFDLEEVWSSVVAEIQSLRGKIQCPLIVKPSLYEENLRKGRFNLPAVIGVVKNSPAAQAGVKMGDRILSVGGLRVLSRPQARDLLRLHHQNRTSPVPLTIQRGEENLELSISTDRFQYPYLPATDHHLGMIFMGSGFRPSILEDLKSLLRTHGAKRVLLLSSRLVKPIFQQLIQESPLFGDVRIQVEVPENRFFGGNIFMGDLLVVQDFIFSIQQFLQRNPPPDLIVIPSSPFALSPWKRDLEGRVYTDIERAVGLPVALLDCEPIYD